MTTQRCRLLGLQLQSLVCFDTLHRTQFHWLIATTPGSRSAALYRHISSWVLEDGGGGGDGDLESWLPCSRRPTDWLAPFRHFSITATTAAALPHNHRRRSPTRRTNEKSLRATAPALPKKWTTRRATRGGEKLNLSDEVRRRVERQLRDSVCVGRPASWDTYNSTCVYVTKSDASLQPSERRRVAVTDKVDGSVSSQLTLSMNYAA